MTLDARGSRRHRGSLELVVVVAGARASLTAPEPGFGEEVSRQLIRVGRAMPKDTSQLASLRFCPGSQARTPELAWMDSESRGDVIWSASHVLRLGSMRWLRGTSSSWVVNGMVKSGRMWGVRWWIWLSVDGDQELGRKDKNRCGKGTGFAAPLKGLGRCCVTPGLRDPSCPTLSCSCPGNQGPVIHPELPSPWSRGETAEPLGGGWCSCCCPGRAIGLVQNGGHSPTAGLGSSKWEGWWEGHTAGSHS